MVVQTTCQACSGLGYEVSDKCMGCAGSGTHTQDMSIKVRFPAGVSTGNRLRVPGMGDHGPMGPGDLYIETKVQKSPVYTRSGNDVHSKLDLTITEACLGCTKSVKTIHGEKSVNVPVGTQGSSRLRLSGMGIKSGTPGDHILVVDVRIPTSLSDEQKDLMTKLMKTGI